MADGNRRLHLVLLLAIASLLASCTAPTVTARSERSLVEPTATPEPTVRPIPTPALDSATDEPIDSTADEPLSTAERAELLSLIDAGCATGDRDLVAEAIRSAERGDATLPVLFLELRAAAEERPDLFEDKCATVTGVFNSATEDAPIDDEPTEDQNPAEDEPVDDDQNAAQDEPTENEPVEDQNPAEDEPTEDQPVEDQPVDDQPTDEDEPVVEQVSGPALSADGVADIGWGGSLGEAVAMVTQHFGAAPDVEQSASDNLWYYQWGDVALRSADQETLHSWIGYDPAPGLPITGISGLTANLTLAGEPVDLLRSTWPPVRGSDAMGTISWVDSSVLILWREATVQDIDAPYPPDFPSMDGEFFSIVAGEGFGWRSQGAAVVTSDDVDVRLAPSLDAQVIDQAFDGDDYVILDRTAADGITWLALAPADTNQWSGWVDAAFVQTLANP